METNTKETYGQMMQRHEEEFGEFPIVFAFSDKQLEEGLEKLGATKDECTSVAGGGIIRRSDAEALNALMKRLDDELTTAMLDDEFLIEAMKYELDNHEFGYTGDWRDAVEALGIEELDERQRRCLDVAMGRA